jgi:hypothetical protein
MRVSTPKGGGFKSVKAPKVATPRNNPMGRVRPPLGMPHVAAPRVKPKKGVRAYSKIAVPDPSQASDQWANSGFGMTGMTGES